MIKNEYLSRGATKALKNGDFIEVDADKVIVRKIV
jgi:hypothetical protein